MILIFLASTFLTTAGLLGHNLYHPEKQLVRNKKIILIVVIVIVVVIIIHFVPQLLECLLGKEFH